MSDRELLGLAAKAAGLSIDFNDALPFVDGIKYFDGGGNGDWWNPLTDDGDALRLAVKLQLTVCNEHISAGVAYCVRHDEETYPEVRSGTAQASVVDSDYAATRRSIVCAAAEIGKAAS